MLESAEFSYLILVTWIQEISFSCISMWTFAMKETILEAKTGTERERERRTFFIFWAVELGRAFSSVTQTWWRGGRV